MTMSLFSLIIKIYKYGLHMFYCVGRKSKEREIFHLGLESRDHRCDISLVTHWPL